MHLVVQTRGEFPLEVTKRNFSKELRPVSKEDWNNQSLVTSHKECMLILKESTKVVATWTSNTDSAALKRSSEIPTWGLAGLEGLNRFTDTTLDSGRSLKLLGEPQPWIDVVLVERKNKSKNKASPRSRCTTRAQGGRSP